MPVRFKGLSEYQRNFLWKKSYLSESGNSSVGRRYPWAGLRSDQLGITKEPSFISKRRVPYHDPQISKSLEWNGALSESDVVVSPQPEAPETPESQQAEHKDDFNQEKVLALEASRVPKETRSHSAESKAEGASDIVENNKDVIANHIPVNENVEVEHSPKLLSENIDNKLDRFLQKKAGLTVVPSHSVLRNSEYQRQFVWKTPKETAPVFAANQVFHNKSKFVPQFKGNSIIHETEYKRNFKGLSPMKESKLNDLKENEHLEIVSPEKQCNKTDDSLKLEAEMESKDLSQSKKKFIPWRHQRLGKVNSEYKAKYLSPAQYLYKAGAWTRVKENIPSQDSLNAMWYAEVKELREKAEFYRKRVLGTHFSRDHLNQILSDKNWFWDVSSTTSSEGTISSNIRALDLAGSDSSSVSSEKGGRLPTPKLRELGGVQRTHHDLTTPAVGGAVLVSPCKAKSPVPEQKKRTSPQDGLETPKSDFRKKESRAVALVTSPAAGVETADPLPLREDSDINIPKLSAAALPVSKIRECPTNTPGQSPSPPCASSYWHPSRRIQGSLRDPEFQHNVGKARKNNFQLPQHEAFNDEDADRLSEISARSAASSLQAFQTLARAQKRKENFWGKT
ncbi:nuclear protein MDM1 isoform 3-T3 [Glossophaga mutica]